MTKCTCIYGTRQSVLKIVLRDPQCPATSIHEAQTD